MSTVSESKPVRTLYAISAGALVVAAGLPLLTPDSFDWIGPSLGLVGAAIVAGLGKFTEGKVTPVENVAARQLPSGKVVAGPAASQPDGTSVRVVREQLATGGPVSSGTAYLVGESGPEVPGEPFDTPPTPA